MGYYLDKPCHNCGKQKLWVDCICDAIRNPPCGACENEIAICQSCGYNHTGKTADLLKSLNRKATTMDTITLLQIDAGCKLYSCTYSDNKGAQRFVFKSFDTYAPGDFAFVLPTGQKENLHACVVRIEGEGEFSEEIPQYKWLCGPAVLPDMREGERIDTAARRKIAIGGAIAAAKAAAIGLTVADYTPQKIEAPKESS